MGVSGSGKSTVAGALADRLGWVLAEGDDFHPPSNIAKMRSGTPLNDDDRMPWLATIAAWIDARIQAGEPGIVTCSALKRAYRDLLADGRPEVLFVYLKGTVALMSRHLASREGHFMPASLLPTQFESLEEPTTDEPVFVADAAHPVAAIVSEVEAYLRIAA
jgi:carbohydrate kinase (thermoresistant glucokinase family)